MKSSIARVAHQYLTRLAGVLEAPPAMHEAIYEWVLATIAKTHINTNRATIKYQNTTARRELAERLKPLEDAMAALEAAPTNWKAYKAVHENSWALGSHPGSRWSIKGFQKMTPEKRATLEKRVKTLLGYLHENTKRGKERPDDFIKNVKKDTARLKPYVRSGVKGLDAEGAAQREFDVDLTGWRYEGEVGERLQERIKAQWGRYEKKCLERGEPDMAQEAREMMEFALKQWGHITVRLSSESVRNARASWREEDLELWVKVPQGAAPHELQGLGGSVRHELQHFAQTYLTRALTGGTGQVGWEHIDQKRRPRPGMPSRHIMTPEYMQGMEETAEAKQLRIRRVRQGLPGHAPDFHALDDIEFYTDLSDAIDRFNRAASRAGSMTSDQKRTVLKLFIGAIPHPDNQRFRDTGKWNEANNALGGYDLISHFQPDRFFLALRRRAKGKYRKAVGEITKAVL